MLTSFKSARYDDDVGIVVVFVVVFISLRSQTKTTNKTNLFNSLSDIFIKLKFIFKYVRSFFFSYCSRVPVMVMAGRDSVLLLGFFSSVSRALMHGN